MIAGLKPYPSYKGSGVAWLGNMPVHWTLRRTKTLLQERSSKGFPNEPLLAATQTRGVVHKEQYENRTVLAQKDLHLLKLVREGDFVVSLRSFQGGLEYARQQGIISPAYTVLYPRDERNRAYFSRVFKSRPYIDNLRLFVTGIRQGQNIDYAKLSRSSLPCPPLTEQAAIARFLDYTDRRIRRYIRATEKRIALLEEQEQAIIHQAVTGQIDIRTGKPYPAYKDAGPMWINAVPEHWTVTALRHRYAQCLGKMLDTKRITGDAPVPYLRNTDVQWDQINCSDLPLMDIYPKELTRYTVEPEDLLVCEGGEIGRCAIWQGEIECCGFQKALHRLRPLKATQDRPRFLMYAIWAAASRGAFQDGHQTTIGHLTGEKLRAQRFAFPPIREQFAIADHIDQARQRIDSLVESQRILIVRFHEYRTRLIADVVTGKLDVCEAAVAFPEAAPA